MKTIEEIRAAFLHVHHYAIGKTERAYMSIPADQKRDADLIVAAAIEELEKLRTLAMKVDEIRNSIIGGQRFNFSEHGYPLVAALEEAGYGGEPYPVARKNLGTRLERVATLEGALRDVLPLASNWADGKSRGHPEHDLVDRARTVLGDTT